MRILIGSTSLALASMAMPATAQEDPLPRATPVGNPGVWIPPNSYPPAAKASAEEGRVAFTLTIDELGRVSDCTVTTTSQSPLLDEVTCTLMSANGRFTPPRNRKNKPTASQWSSAVRWKLDAPSAPLATTPALNNATGKK